MIEALVATLVRGALDGCAPRPATRRALEGRALREPLSLLAFGKCAAEMTRGALDVVAPRETLVIMPAGAHDDLVARGVRVRIGTHPTPCADAPAHAREAIALAARVAPEGTLLVLVSGGGSALLELPAPSLSLARIVELTRALMLAGAPIEELNVVRAALSSVKGGRLAAHCRAEVVTLICEDVPGHPELVASGPTARPPVDDARRVLARFAVPLDAALEAALARAAPTMRETGALEVVVGNDQARRGVCEAARRCGLALRDLGIQLRGEAREAGARLRELAGEDAVVVGGETTVHVTGAGRGGRNQELVLGAYLRAPSGLVVALGTDGIDGASTNAGAYLDPSAWARALARGLDPAAALAQNDSATFFERLGTAIVTGPTGTNAADLAIFVPRILSG